MFPDNRLSTTLMAAPYTYPYTLTPPNKRTAYAMGGIALRDPSQGLNVQLWTATADATTIYLKSEAQDYPIDILSMPDVSDLTLGFDQNMNFALGFTQYSTAHLYWFDTALGQYVNTGYANAISPRLTLDDRRVNMSGTSDLIYGYVRNDNLYFRMQRDRFLVEYLLKENVQARLINMGLNTMNRMQFQLKPYRT